MSNEIVSISLCLNRYEQPTVNVASRIELDAVNNDILTN